MSEAIPRAVLNKAIRQAVTAALREDTAPRDITTRLACHPKQDITALVRCHEQAVFCGRPVIEEVFRRLDPACRIKWFVKEGERVSADALICRLHGRARALLAGERTALNFLARLSGVATLTRRYVDRLPAGSHAAIYATRKTTPGLRILEKWAVCVGGGRAHRANLSAAVMIKDNHRLALKTTDMTRLIRDIRRKTKAPIYLEADDFEQFLEGLKAGVDVIILDNMPLETIKRAVARRNAVRAKTLLEVSGGVTIRRLPSIADCGVERISVGALTQKAANIDYSMEAVP